MSMRKAQLILFTIIFLISIAMPSFSNVCMAILIALNFIFIVSNSSTEFSVLSTMVMGNEMFMIINSFVCLIALLINKKSTLKLYRGKTKKSVVIIIGFVLINSITNGILNDTLVNVVFYVIYLLILYVCYIGFKDVLDVKKVIGSLYLIIIMEFIATLLRISILHSIDPGDYFAGTTNNAHFFGNWLMLTMFFISGLYKKRAQGYINRKKFVVMMGLCLIMLYLADAKGIILSFAIAVAMYYIIRFFSLKKENAVFWVILGMYIVFTVTVFFFSVPSVRDFLQSRFPIYSVYLYKDGWNGRYQYFYGTLFDSLANEKLFFGYGLGQYGSRISNAFAYDVMWRNNSFINNFIADNFSPHHVENYTKYISYYTQDLVAQIGWRSAVLTYPFSSFLSLLTETGIVGVILIALYINKEFRKSRNKFMVIYFLSICILDIYFDDFPCVISLIIYLGINTELLFQDKGIEAIFQRKDRLSSNNEK